MADHEVELNNESATYISYPLIFLELTDNMPALDPYTFLQDDAPVIDIHRVESPNFGRRLFIYQVELTPAPTALAPVRIYIDTMNRVAFVDPDNAHAQAGELLQIFHPASRFFYVLPGIVNTIAFNNVPEDGSVSKMGLRWRKAYSG